MEIKYGNKLVTTPDTLDDITLDQFLQFKKVSSMIKRDGDPIENALKTFKLVEILCNITEDEVYNLSIADMNNILSNINNFITTTIDNYMIKK